MAHAIQEGTALTGGLVLKRRIKVGGVGEIWEAIDQQGQPCAVKLLKEEYATDDNMKKRFAEEGPVTRQLAGPHVVKVLAYGEDPHLRLPYIAMELLRGRDLASEVERRHKARPGEPAFTQEEVFLILDQVCVALESAHRQPQPIAHRDLTPANVYVCDEQFGGGSLIKLIDFGFAKLGADKSAALGTPKWAAPEQIKGDVQTPRTDIWALGLLAFWLFTGKHFFRSAERNDPVALFGEITTNRQVSAMKRASEYGCMNRLPPNFDVWFPRCLASDPEARFADASRARRELALMRNPDAEQSVPLSVAGGGSAALPPTSGNNGFGLGSAPVSPLGPSSSLLGETMTGASARFLQSLRLMRRRSQVLLAAVLLLLGIPLWRMVNNRLALGRCNEFEDPLKRSTADTQQAVEACRQACSYQPGRTCQTWGDLLAERHAEPASVQAAYARACQYRDSTPGLWTACYKEAIAALDGGKAPSSEVKQDARKLLEDTCRETLRNTAPSGMPVCRRLAKFYRAEGNSLKALGHFQESCDKREQGGEGCYETGKHFEQITPANIGQSIKYYKQGCDLGHSGACLRMARIHLSGLNIKTDGKIDPVDLQKLTKDACESLETYEKNCKKDGVWSATADCGLVPASASERNPTQALRDACIMNEPVSLRRELGTLYAKGVVVAKNENLALELFESPCNSRDPLACRSKAQLLCDKGRREESQAYFRKAHSYDASITASCQGGAKIPPVGIDAAPHASPHASGRSIEKLAEACERSEKDSCRQLCVIKKRSDPNSDATKMYCRMAQ